MKLMGFPKCRGWPSEQGLGAGLLRPPCLRPAQSPLPAAVPVKIPVRGQKSLSALPQISCSVCS